MENRTIALDSSSVAEDQSEKSKPHYVFVVVYLQPHHLSVAFAYELFKM